MQLTTIKRRMVLPLALGLGALCLMAVTPVAGASHVRPKGASPLRVPLVPAYAQCTTPNRTHGEPLAFPSCNPPVQASDFLTVGTPEANSAGANADGFILFKVRPSSFEGEAVITLSISDVRCQPGTDASVCNSANAADGPDYSGDLLGNATIRISDHYNGSGLNEAATVRDIQNPVNATCVQTADTSIGGFCNATTSAPCPPNCSIGGRRTVVEIAQIEVTDGGADGNVFTAGNTTFLRQGLFIP